MRRKRDSRAEYGFASWNKLREEVEARSLEFDAAVTGFWKAADRGARSRRAHPRPASKIRAASFYHGARTR